MLSDSDIEILNEARTILSEIESEANRTAWQADTRGDAAGLGHLAEAASSAEYHVFMVLNVARSRCEFAITEEQMHNRQPVEEPTA